MGELRLKLFPFLDPITNHFRSNDRRHTTYHMYDEPSYKRRPDPENRARTIQGQQENKKNSVDEIRQRMM